jgi:hypothetical protein
MTFMLMATCALLASTAAAQVVTVVQDPLDSGQGWTVEGGSFGTNANGLLPSAGTSYWGSTFHLTATVGVSKTFSGVTVMPGTYTLLVDTASPYPPSQFSSGYRPVALSDFQHFGLTGMSAPRVTVSAPTPAAETAVWTTWELRYDVPAGDPGIGSLLGFRALVTATNYDVLLDNVRVSYTPIPEPAVATVFVGAALAGLSRRRRTWIAQAT